MKRVQGGNELAIYQLRVTGELAPDWTEWFDGLNVVLQRNGETVLVSLVRDQAMTMIAKNGKGREIELSQMKGTCIRLAGESYGLTAREKQVLAEMVEGNSNREIAAALTVSVSTAKSHVSSILSKMGAESRTEAVALAMQQQSRSSYRRADSGAP